VLLRLVVVLALVLLLWVLEPDVFEVLLSVELDSVMLLLLVVVLALLLLVWVLELDVFEVLL